jgi:ribosomal protein S18 acetylase RimI-like enzyme
MNVRPATAADAQPIAQIQVDTWRAAYRGHLPDAYLDQLNVESRSCFWRERISQAPGVTCLVGAETVLGFCDLMPSRDRDVSPPQVGEIVSIYVHPRHWRCGAGRMLAEHALREARYLGFQSVTLWVLASNQNAIAFYQALGFIADNAQKTEKLPDGTELAEVRYRFEF